VKFFKFQLKMVLGRLIFKRRVKVKPKFILEQIMVDQKGGRAKLMQFYCISSLTPKSMLCSSIQCCS